MTLPALLAGTSRQRALSWRGGNGASLSAACNTDASSFASTHGYVMVPNAPASSIPGKSSNAQIRPGNLQRNSSYAPGYEDLDLSVKKVFAFAEKANFQLRMDAFDSLNHTNLTDIVATVNSSSFGQLTKATTRSVKIGGRIEFLIPLVVLSAR